MLVEKHRDDASVATEDGDDLIEQLLPWVELLAKLIERIIAVLADPQHSVHGQVRAPEGERLPNCREQWNTVFGAHGSS
jgi:hypothetical protein